MILRSGEIVLLWLDKVVLPPFVVPFSMLKLDDHLLFLSLELPRLHRNFQACHSFCQQSFAQGSKCPDLIFMEISAQIPISYVVNFLLENEKLFLHEVPVSNFIKLWLNDKALNNFTEVSPYNASFVVFSSLHEQCIESYFLISMVIEGLEHFLHHKSCQVGHRFITLVFWIDSIKSISLQSNQNLLL